MSPFPAATGKPAQATVIETEVLIVGGGVTGTGIMRDLALRGIPSILIDRRDLCAGASGGNHGLLHSGARYVSTDPQSARECMEENALLKRLAPQCIEDTGGLFVAVDGDDPDFAEQFPELCRRAGITCEELAVAAARKLEPRLSERLVKACRVPDAAIDPFRLALENVSHARQLVDSQYHPHTEVIRFEMAGGEIRRAICRDGRGDRLLAIHARQFVNAAGAWAMNIARLAGCDDVRLLWSKGTLLVTNERLARHVINRLRPPDDGDILVPGGTVSLLGTTATRTEELDAIGPTVAEVDRNIREGATMIPALAGARYIRAFSRVRPLLQGSGTANDRVATRGFALCDHATQGLNNFCTITGGKLTTFRRMAESASDLVARRLGNSQSGTTSTVPLPDDEAGRWTEPGAAPRRWYRAHDAKDMILCECELVSRSAIEQIVDGAPEAVMSIEAIALRSRAGKGTCQGSFCGIRICSHLYDSGHYSGATGLMHMRDFLEERFKGQRTVIWGQQAAQMELAEALHCGLLGLDTLGHER